MSLFEFTTEVGCRYMGISKIIVEWDDCKDEQFCELTFAKAFVLDRYPERRAAQLDKV